MLTKAGIIEIKTLARKLIQVIFEEAIVIDNQFLLDTNYSITTLDSGANAVVVRAIRGYDLNNYTTTLVNLEVSQTTLDVVYEINISNLKTTDGLTLVGLRGFFTGRNTKYDAAMGFFPNYVSNDFSDILPNILLAVSKSDEEMGGGTGDFRPLPRSTSTGASTFGTATFGTNTLGG